MAEPKSSAELRLVLRIHHRTTVAKFASLVNPSGQTVRQPFLTYLKILWQQGEKTNRQTHDNKKQQTQQPVFPETLMFLLQCTLDNK